jgi:glucokinase
MKVIGIDLGGTKVAAGVMNEKGKILDETWAPTELGGGWSSLKAQLVRTCRELQAKHGRIHAIGIGSAGPLHAPSGRLLDPTNFGWTSPLVVKITAELERILRKPVRLENDAAAAVLAESWKGGGGTDCVVVTLGTGLGVGVIANGRLVRGGRGLHPETGHLIIGPNDASAPCGCGALGCAEAYLSGVNFGLRAARRLNMEGITAKQVAEMARNGHAEALAMFDEYASLMSVYLNNLVVLFYPKKVIFTGSFAEAHPLFLDTANARLAKLLERRMRTLPILPELKVSKLGNRAGILGAGYIALHKDYA